MRQVVPAVALICAGCFQSHGMTSSSRCGPSDAVCCTPDGFIVEPLDDCPFSCPRGARPLERSLCGPSGFDASVGRDAAGGPMDAGPACPAVRADVACFDGAEVPAGRGFSLPMTFDQCGCCPQTQCAVEVDAARRVIRAATALCPDPCDCDQCVLPQVSCDVPALAAGDWLVEVNGSPAFTMRAGSAAPGATCIDFAEVDPGCATPPALPGSSFPIENVCVERLADHLAIDVVDECGGCEIEGECEVRIEPRLTDDLPPGQDLFVSARRTFSACGAACDPVCIRTPRRCLVPIPLEGDVHRVFVDGAPRLSFGPSAGAVCTISP